MTIQEEIFTRLTGYSGLTALIDKRVYYMRMPQKHRLPAIVYQKISGPKLYSHDGEAGLAYPRIQFSCMADDPDEATSVAAQLQAALSAYTDSGLTTPIEASFILNEFDDYEQDTDIYRVLVDYRIWHGD